MSRAKGTFTYSANLEPAIKAPIDARTLVNSYEDLTKTTTWLDAYNNIWVYVGMIVGCKDRLGEVFQLTDEDYTQEKNWVSIGKNNVEERLTAIENTLLQLQNKISGVGDTTETIDTLPEIINFLKDYKNTETLKEEVQIDAEAITDEQFNDVF